MSKTAYQHTGLLGDKDLFSLKKASSPINSLDITLSVRHQTTFVSCPLGSWSVYP